VIQRVCSCHVDCPVSVNVAPSSGEFRLGDVLTCTSDGYPEPSYTWTDGDGVVMSTASTTTLLNPGPFILTCTATGNFTGPCTASHRVSGYAVGKKQLQLMVTIIVSN